MANDSFPSTGFVISVDPGEEATVEPVKEDFNFLHGKFDSITGHEHNATAGHGVYVYAPFLIERLTEGPIQPVNTFKYVDTYSGGDSDPWWKSGSWCSGNISSTGFTTVFSKQFTNMPCKNNKIYLELAWSIYEYSVAGGEGIWEYETDIGWKTIGSASYASSADWNTAYFRTMGVLLFDGKSPFNIRFRGKTGDSGYPIQLAIANQSSVILWK